MSAYCSDPVLECDAGCKPGAVALGDTIIAVEDKITEDVTNAGCYNCRHILGSSKLSLHAQGRARDLHIVNWAAWRLWLGHGSPIGYRISRNLALHGAVLGIQEVVWAGQVWSAERPYWHPYTGRNKHYDHVHVGLCWDSARHLTTATVMTVLYPAPTPPHADQPADEEEPMVILTATTDTKPGEKPQVTKGDIFSLDGGVCTGIPDPATKTALSKIPGATAASVSGEYIRRRLTKS